MYKKIAGRLFELQRQSGLLEEKDRSLYEYAYGLLLNRAIIYFIIAGLCIITGNWVEILAFLLPFTILRQYAGGIHLERAASCMVVFHDHCFRMRTIFSEVSDHNNIICNSLADCRRNYISTCSSGYW